MSMRFNPADVDADGLTRPLHPTVVERGCRFGTANRLAAPSAVAVASRRRG
jgi:hypothetical protein